MPFPKTTDFPSNPSTSKIKENMSTKVRFKILRNVEKYYLNKQIDIDKK